MTYLKIHHMPGPTPEAQAAQLQQRELLDALYAAYNATRTMDSPECKEARTAYDKSVQALETMLGKDVPCSFVDCEMSDTFSDFYKSVHGFRPHCIDYNRQQVQEWFDRQPVPIVVG
jgi:hypothetical protein